MQFVCLDGGHVFSQGWGMSFDSDIKRNNKTTGDNKLWGTLIILNYEITCIMRDYQ